MPRSDHETTLARQWELLSNHVPTYPRVRSALELQRLLEASGHKVSKRTVERDMVELSCIFPIASDKHTPKGWYWIKGYHFDVMGMDLSEAVSLGLMEDVLRQIMPPAFLSALEGRFSMAREKLKALPKIPHARWKDLVRYIPPGLPFIPPAISSNVLAVVQEALLNQRQINVVYQKVGADEAKEQTLHPLSLIQQGSRSYLVATAFGYDTILFYALHRMVSAEVLDQPVKRPKGYTMDAHIASGAAQFGTGDPLVLQARVSEDLVRLLEETPISMDQKISKRAGVHTLRATVHDSWNLHFWILSQGASITVLKPVSLRKQIIAGLENALGNYQS